MYTLPLFLVAVIPGAEIAPAPRDASPPTKEVVRAAVTKGLLHLQQSSTAWKTDRKCVSCHQVPFTIWALTEAKARGFTVDAAKIEDLTAWSFNFCTTNEDKGQKTGGFHLTMVDMILSQSAAPTRADSLKAYPFFETMLAKRQKEDGSWREGNQIKVAGAQREADDVDTMWTLLAIRELSGAGIPVRALIAPVIPGLNDSEIPAILEAVREAGAVSAGYTLLRLPWTVAPVFLEWLDRTRPDARSRIEGRIRQTRGGRLNDSDFSQRMRGDGPIAQQIRQMFRLFAKRHGLDEPLPGYDTTRFRPPRPTSGQLWLF